MFLLPSQYVFHQPETLNLPAPALPRVVEAITNRRQFNEFLALPRSLYRGDSSWAPPLDMEIESFFNARNPFWQHAQAQLFLYRDQGKVLGRVAAILDHDFVKAFGEKVGYFAFYESINDLTVAGALMEAAQCWLASLGVPVMRGPINGRLDNGCGFLLEGFGKRPFVMSSYNPAYYIHLMEGLKFYKAKDLVSYKVDLTKPLPLEAQAHVPRFEQRGFRARQVNLRRWEEERPLLLDMMVLGFADHWGIAPPAPADQIYSIDQVRWLVDPALCLLAEHEGQPVGIRFLTPDFSPIYQRMQGRLTPSGLTFFLRQRNRLQGGKTILMAFLKEYRGQGLGTAMNVYAAREMQRRGYTELEYGWIDENNTASRRAGEKLGGRLDKRYRIYERLVS